MSKKVLITGGSGFIGSNLVNFLIKKKYKIINLDILNYASILDKYKNFTKNKDYVFYKLKVLDYKSNNYYILNLGYGYQIIDESCSDLSDIKTCYKS